jgi:tripartite-type tricarboxylate transporter receptor subunit TctC
MKLPRRKFLQFAGAAVAAPTVSNIATAQAYPTRPITMIVPFPAGGSTDVNGRVVADRMSGSLGRPIIIENISGADGSIGTGRAARAPTFGKALRARMGLLQASRSARPTDHPGHSERLSGLDQEPGRLLGH